MNNIEVQESFVEKEPQPESATEGLKKNISEFTEQESFGSYEEMVDYAKTLGQDIRALQSARANVEIGSKEHSTITERMYPMERAAAKKLARIECAKCAQATAADQRLPQYELAA